MLEEIQHCFRRNRMLYTQHAQQEMRHEPRGRILDNEVFAAIDHAEIIEEYPDDKPYTSCLVFGRTSDDRPVHVVCTHVPEDDIAIVITVYEPDPGRWIDFRRRL